MKITFVFRKKQDEKWVVFDFPTEEYNPFFNDAKAGEQIDLDTLSRFISFAPKSVLWSKLKDFILDSILDGFNDIRYYYS